jgi:hypothetical protein
MSLYKLPKHDVPTITLGRRRGLELKVKALACASIAIVHMHARMRLSMTVR